MANLFPTVQKICWLSFSTFFTTSSEEEQLSKESQPEQKSPAKEQQSANNAGDSNSEPKVKVGVRRRFVRPLSFQSSETVSTSDSPGPRKHGDKAELIYKDIDYCDICKMGVFKTGKFPKASSRSRLPVTGRSGGGQNGSEGNEKGDGISGGEYCCCKSVVVNSSENETIAEECGHLCKRVLSFQDAPLYLRFNPHITGGYRGMLSPWECVKSLFWWTNETLNIWSHLLGWFFFLGLSVYDALGLLDVPTRHPWDIVVFTLLLICFQACMLLSSLYHIFCCHSELFYRRWLSADLLGVSLTLLAIYISGIYYAFACVPFWLNFYLVTVGAIFITAMGMQILPMVTKKEMVTEERFHWRLVVFGGWAAYGVVPTLHWACLHGGFESEAVALLLPRIFGMYVISGFAFLFYVARIPEKFWPGLVNYIGSSHQIWHVLIVVSLYHWHNTGMIYLKFRSTHPCSEEYATLFPTEAKTLQFI